MRTLSYSALLLTAVLAVGACSPTDHPVPAPDFAFDGTCVSCHLGLSAGHVHPSYKLRCIDCHGGNDQVAIPDGVTDVPTGTDPAKKGGGKFRDPDLITQVHVKPKPGLARFFFANGIDDDGDGFIDNAFKSNDPTNVNPTAVVDIGEVYEPGLHGEGPGEFVDSELNRDLNYTRFLNPGDLRVATIGCGSRNRAALDGGGGGGCHQETVDIVRRSIMTNQSAVTNGAYYGNESWRADFISGRGATPDPRDGAFGYALDYDGADGCIDVSAVNDGAGGRGQPRFNSTMCEATAAAKDPDIAAGAPGNAGLPAFEIAQAPNTPVAPSAFDPGSDPATTILHTGAGESRYQPWGGQPILDQTAERASLGVIPNADVPTLPGVPDPVDLILRTFRAYYPLNYPGSTVNQNFTFGTSILPDIAHFKTSNPFGRGHSSGCTACHGGYNYDGTRNPQQVLQDDGTVLAVVDPTTKHREFDAATQDQGMINGELQLIGRAVKGQEQSDTNRAQQKAYSADHTMTTAVTSDTCGLCHGFVTRINYAYQGMAEEEQRDQLSRRKEVDFTTPPPASTQVRIIDSWVREENDPDPTHVQPNGNRNVLGISDVQEGLDVIAKAKKRDADLAAQGLLPGAGGCGANVFSEDCNNNGELDTNLVLTRTDEAGNVIATATINEDLNGNGKLDLIDRLPRESSVDGRQMRYVYGGRNGSTRLMDIHFEKGMHCIDCHFLQDVHGDGHVYSTNWDHIEIECEDCHGAKATANLKTSGPTGGNDLTAAHDANLKPYFENVGGKIIQRSRVTPGLFWEVPQTADQTSGLAKEAHAAEHVGEQREGSTFEGAPGSSKLVTAKVECAACHSSWIHNCVGCHVNANIGDPQRVEVLADLKTLDKTPKENEIWFTNKQNEGHIDFQLLGLMRAPFVLGVSGSSEQGRLTTFRSSMQAMVSITDQNGDSVRDNLSFTTFQAKDGNSGRANVATSGVAMNETMPHTVRPNEARGCETCHTLIDKDGRVRNEHILAETFGLGAGAMQYVGDWGMAAGTGGLELYDYKANDELATNKKGTKSRFPGMVVDACGLQARDKGLVEPVLDNTASITAASTATDIALIRNFNPTPAAVGGTQPPSLTDIAVMSFDTGGGEGRLVITDIGGRGHPASTRQPLSNAASSVVVNLPAPARALAHIGPDVSDPFVYVAVGTAGVSTVHIDGPGLGTPPAAHVASTVALPTGHTANELQLAGDLLYVGTTEGTIEVLDLSDPANPKPVGTPAVVGSTVTGLALSGFMLYAATTNGVAALVLDDPTSPVPPVGATGAIAVPGINAKEIVVSQGHVYVAAGLGGVIDIDMRTPAAPVNLGDITPMLAPGQTINAADVVVSTNPGQVWLLVLDVNGDMWGLKLDNTLSVRERCYPDPAAQGCTLDLPFLDATQSGRDPSLDPATNTFDPCAPSATSFGDLSSPRFFHQVAQILTGGRRLARPTFWEQIGTLTGRRTRDSFMPGSGVLSLEVMQSMRSVQLCESTAASREPGNLGAIGYADATFMASGTCSPLGTSARTVRPRSPKVCSPTIGGAPVNVCRPGANGKLPAGVERATPERLRSEPAGSGSSGPLASR